MRVLTGLLLVVAAVSVVSAGSARAGVGFRITGGYTYITYPDFNDYIGYVNDKELPAMGITEKVDNMHWVPEFGGEFLVSMIPSLEAGLGFGIISGKSDFSYFIGGDGLISEHTVKGYPITATGYFRPSVPFAAFKPFLFGGCGLYYSKITSEQKLEVGGMIVEGYDAELTKWGFGLHGGGGVAFSIAPVISLEIGIRGRWAKLKGYEGTATFTDGEKVDVFYAKEEGPGGYIVVGPELVDNKDEYEEAAVDLSGYGFTVGLKVSF